ncbi:ABC transporter permease [candidate division KSB3 bacterium]|uniref:ABC transporter permease n=1 Tax=candidate division KSB3 bacterium TaxID=2044937 RepID=A0A2G6K7E5_9BACT|nr:MAG: ABC transporter permease [candidate division KSB3 bacterium]
MKTMSNGTKSRLKKIQFTGELSLVIAFVLICAFFSTQSEYFLTARNFIAIGQNVSVIGIIAVAECVVLISGGLDLSVGAMTGLSSVVTGRLAVSLGVPIGLAILAGLVVGALLGYVVAVIVTRIGINPLITTLGFLSINRGTAFVMSGGLAIQMTASNFKWLGRGNVFGVPVPIILMLFLYIAAYIVMKYTGFGRAIYAIGGNPQASRLAGVNVTGIQTVLYIFCGMTAAFGGIVVASQLGAAAPQTGTGLELSVIAAVILGGTSLQGGSGNMLGTLLGVVILGTVNNGLVLMNVSSFYQMIASGVILVLAVGVDQIRLRLRR